MLFGISLTGYSWVCVLLSRPYLEGHRDLTSRLMIGVMGALYGLVGTLSFTVASSLMQDRKLTGSPCTIVQRSSPKPYSVDGVAS